MVCEKCGKKLHVGAYKCKGKYHCSHTCCGGLSEYVLLSRLECGDKWEYNITDDYSGVDRDET